MLGPWAQDLVRGQLEDVVTAAHHVLAAARVRHGVGRQARGGGAARAGGVPHGGDRGE